MTRNFFFDQSQSYKSINCEIGCVNCCVSNPIVLLKNLALTIEESKPQHKGIDSAIHCINACYANSDQYMNRGKFLKRTDLDKFPSKSKPPA